MYYRTPLTGMFEVEEEKHIQVLCKFANDHLNDVWLRGTSKKLVIKVSHKCTEFKQMCSIAFPETEREKYELIGTVELTVRFEMTTIDGCCADIFDGYTVRKVWIESTGQAPRHISGDGDCPLLSHGVCSPIKAEKEPTSNWSLLNFPVFYSGNQFHFDNNCACLKGTKSLKKLSAYDFVEHVQVQAEEGNPLKLTVCCSKCLPLEGNANEVVQSLVISEKLVPKQVSGYAFFQIDKGEDGISTKVSLHRIEDCRYLKGKDTKTVFEEELIEYLDTHPDDDQLNFCKVCFLETQVEEIKRGVFDSRANTDKYKLTYIK